MAKRKRYAAPESETPSYDQVPSDVSPNAQKWNEQYREQLHMLVDVFCDSRARRIDNMSGSVLKMEYSPPYNENLRSLSAAIVAMVDPSRCEPPVPSKERN